MARSWVPNPAAKVGTLHAEHNIPWMLGFSHSISRQKKQLQKKTQPVGEKNNLLLGQGIFMSLCHHLPQGCSASFVFAFSKAAGRSGKPARSAGIEAVHQGHQQETQDMTMTWKKRVVSSLTHPQVKKNIFYVLFVGASQSNQQFLK